MRNMRLSTFLAAVVTAILLIPVSSFATLIGDSVDVDVAGDVYNGVVVTNGGGAELFVNSTENVPDETISFDFEDYYIDITLDDWQSGAWLWLDAGSTFNITISSLDTGWGAGIAGLSLTGTDVGMVSAYSILTSTSISLDMVNQANFTSGSFRVNLHEASVPEPSTLLLLGSGLVGLGFVRRRFKK